MKVVLKENLEAMYITGENMDADVLTQSDGYDGSVPGNMAEVAMWAGSSVTVGHDRFFEIEIFGPGSIAHARPGDWVIKFAPGRTLVLDDESFNNVFLVVDATT